MEFYPQENQYETKRSLELINSSPNSDNRSFAWRALYIIGGVAALIAVIFFRRYFGVELVQFKGFGIIPDVPLEHPGSADEWLRKYAGEFNGKITETGQIASGTIIFEWVRIEAAGKLLNVFIGAAELPGKRAIKIEAQQSIGNEDLGWRVFKKVAESISFENNLLLENGIEVVRQLYNKPIIGNKILCA